MKCLWFLLIAALGFPCSAISKETEIIFELPDALKFDTPEDSGGREHLKEAFDLLGVELRAQGKPLVLAEARLDKGKPVEDAELLEKLVGIHQRANELLQPPLLFPRTLGRSPSVDLLYLYRSANLLARNSLLTGDSKSADQFLNDMLRWNHDLQAARPSMFDSLMALAGWRFAFNTMLLDWAGRADQTARLAEIAGVHDRFRLSRAELVDVVKSEAAWCARFCDVSRLLKDGEHAESMMMLLESPFNKLKAEELLKLPYDAKADFQREMDTKVKLIEGLKSGKPFNQWMDSKVVATGHRLEDYASRPNGLGDLFHEQSSSMGGNSSVVQALNYSVLLDACLFWLKLESTGINIQAADFSDFTDPADGKPLSIDFSQRVIRCRGINGKFDAPDLHADPLPAAGFHGGGGDLGIVVPKWKRAPKTGN